MQNTPSLLTRDDTFFGVCQALGEDFGFNPLWLRLALGGLLFWNPVAVISAYLVAGVLVAAIRWFVPNPVSAAAASESEAAAGGAEAHAYAEAEAARADEEGMKLAA